MILASRSAAAVLLSLSFACPGVAPAAFAKGDASRSWRVEKCLRYKRAWSQAVSRLGPRGLGKEFLDRHAGFLASGCTARSKVCPRSAEELRLANIMVVLAMNAGTASTFPPFGCAR